MLPKLASVDDPMERKQLVLQELRSIGSDDLLAKYLGFVSSVLSDMEGKYEVSRVSG